MSSATDPPAVTTEFLYRTPSDPGAVSSGMYQLPPPPDGRGLRGRPRCVVVRVCEAIMAIGRESLDLMLAQLNHKLLQLRDTLLDASFEGYIVGFNLLDDPSPRWPPFKPPTELLLVLLGAPDGEELSVSEFAGGKQYPRLPWLEREPAYYRNWSDVFERVGKWAEKRNRDENSACDIVEAALHLIGGALVFPAQPRIDLNEYGSSLVLTQYRRESDKCWVTTHIHNVRDVRVRELPEGEESLGDRPHFAWLSGRESFAWTDRNARVTYTETAGNRATVRLHVAAGAAHFDSAIRAGMARRRFFYAENAAETLKYFAHLAEEGRASGDLSALLEDAMTHFLSHGYDVLPLTTLEGHTPLVTLERGLHLIMDTLELGTTATSSWRSPISADSAGIVAFDGTIPSFAHPGVLLTINVVLINHVDAPRDPRRAAAAVRARRGSRDRGHDKRANTPFAEAPSCDRTTLDVVEFENWTVPERAGPAHCAWIAAVILNRLRAVYFARHYLGMPARLSDWYTVPMVRYLNEFEAIRGRSTVRRIPTRDGDDATECSDAYLYAEDPSAFPAARLKPVALFPGLLERRPLIGSDGSLNMRWLLEVYSHVYHAVNGDRPADEEGHHFVDPLAGTESQIWETYSTHFIEDKGPTRAIQWYYWRLNVIRTPSLSPVPLYEPASGIERRLWTSEEIFDDALIQALRRAPIQRDLPLDRIGSDDEDAPASPPPTPPRFPLSARPKKPPALMAPRLDVPASPSEPAVASTDGAPPHATVTILPVAEAPPGTGRDDVILLRDQAVAHSRMLAKQYTEAYNTLKKRYGDNDDLNRTYEAAQRVIADLEGIDTRADDSLAVISELFNKVSGTLNELLGRVKKEFDLELSVRQKFNERILGDGFKERQLGALKELLGGLKVYKKLEYASSTGAGDTKVLEITYQNLLKASTHEAQLRTIDSLALSSKRVTDKDDQRELLQLARGWSQQLSATRSDLEALGTIVKDSREGATLRDHLGIMRSARTTSEFKLPSDKIWPSQRFEGVGSLEAFIEREVDGYFVQWKTDTQEILERRLDTFLGAYIAVRDSFYRQLLSPKEGHGTLMERARLTWFAGDEAWQGALVIEIAPVPTAAANFLRDAVLAEPSDSKNVFERLRTKYLDCVVLAPLADEKSVFRGLWDELQRSFIEIKKCARLLEDYFKAFVDTVAVETGWCAYARKRHWAYVPDDPSNFELVSGTVKEWRSYTRWADVRHGVRRAARGEDGAEKKKSSTEDSVTLPKAEHEALKEVERLWTRMWDSVMVQRAIAVKGADEVRIPCPEIRFVQLGNTLEECWSRLEVDGTLYSAMLSQLLPKVVPLDSPDRVSKVFLCLTHAMLGADSLDPDTLPTVEVIARDRVAAVTRISVDLHKALLATLLEGLAQLAIWPSADVTPTNWWHGNSTFHEAYKFGRYKHLLTPKSDSTDDDFHGMTIALTEFFAFGQGGLWDRYNEHNVEGDAGGKKSKPGEAERSGARDGLPVTRPTAPAIALATIRCEARRRRAIDSKVDALRFSKWVAQCWADGDIPRIIAMARTYSRMVTRGTELRLECDLPPNEFTDGWDLRTRTDALRDPDVVVTEGYELLRALAREVGMLVFGAATGTSGSATLTLRPGSTKGPLTVALYRLLTCLESGEMAGKGGVPTDKELTACLSRWVYQQSSAASTTALAMISAPAQWTHVLGLLLQRDYAPLGIVDRTPAAERLRRLENSASATIPTLVSQLEGDTASHYGTRFVPPKKPKEGYDRALFSNEAVAAAEENGTYRVAWPVALAQAVRRRLQRGSDAAAAAAAAAAEAPPTQGDVLSFLYATLLRDDTVPSNPVPFFIATRPESPNGDVYYSGFSAQAAADYCANSRYRTEMDVITPDKVCGLAQLEHYARYGIEDKTLSEDDVGDALERLFNANRGNRNRIIVCVDTEEKIEGNVLDTLRNPDTAPYIAERGVFALVRRSTSQSLYRQTASEWWSFRSAWCVARKDVENAEDSEKVIETLKLKRIEPRVLGTLAHEQQRRLYFNPLYPVSGRYDPKPSAAGWGRWERAATDEGDAMAGERFMKWVVLKEVLRFSTALSEKSALVDWYERLVALDQKRRLRSDYAAILNGDGSLAYALRRSGFSDALTDARLDELKRAFEERLELFEKAAHSLFERLNDKHAMNLDPIKFSLYQELHDTSIARWIVDSKLRMLEPYEKAREAITKAIGKRASAEVTRAKIDKALQKYVNADRLDSRKRDGWLAALVGTYEEVVARGIGAREELKQRVLASIHDDPEKPA